MDDNEERIILVDEADREVGLAPKLAAHAQGLRHRAISVSSSTGEGECCCSSGRVDKYHSGGLWTNACCTHPRAGETAEAAARRRLYEELGVDCDLRFACALIIAPMSAAASSRTRWCICSSASTKAL